MKIEFSDISTAITSAYVVSPHFFHVVAVAWKAGAIHAGAAIGCCVAYARRFF